MRFTICPANSCDLNQIGSSLSNPCRYASEGIKAACDWAYKDVSEDSVLQGK